MQITLRFLIGCRVFYRCKQINNIQYKGGENGFSAQTNKKGYQSSVKPSRYSVARLEFSRVCKTLIEINLLLR